MGSDLALLFVRESYKDVGVLPRFQLHGLVQRRQQGRATPVVDHSIPVRHTIEMCSYNNHPVGTPRQYANDVRQFGPLHRLFGKVWFIATRFRKHLFKRCLPLRVVTGIPFEALFDDLPRDRLVPNGLGMRIDEGTTLRITAITGTGVGFASIVGENGDSQIIAAVPAQAR